MTYKLTNSLIRSVTVTRGANFPAELVKIHFGKIEWAYAQQKCKGGGLAGNIAAGWNLERNCRV